MSFNEDPMADIDDEVEVNEEEITFALNSTVHDHEQQHGEQAVTLGGLYGIFEAEWETWGISQSNLENASDELLWSNIQWQKTVQQFASNENMENGSTNNTTFIGDYIWDQQSTIEPRRMPSPLNTDD
jgi:hypothetical protein